MATPRRRGPPRAPHPAPSRTSSSGKRGDPQWITKLEEQGGGSRATQPQAASTTSTFSCAGYTALRAPCASPPPSSPAPRRPDPVPPSPAAHRRPRPVARRPRPTGAPDPSPVARRPPTAACPRRRRYRSPPSASNIIVRVALLGPLSASRHSSPPLSPSPWQRLVGAALRAPRTQPRPARVAREHAPLAWRRTPHDAPGRIHDVGVLVRGAHRPAHRRRRSQLPAPSTPPPPSAAPRPHQAHLASSRFRSRKRKPPVPAHARPASPASCSLLPNPSSAPAPPPHPRILASLPPCASSSPAPLLPCVCVSPRPTTRPDPVPPRPPPCRTLSHPAARELERITRMGRRRGSGLRPPRSPDCVGVRWISWMSLYKKQEARSKKRWR
ncbi:hypothetical protein B0H15DRAFT_952513 [Mycena belliarum]|uniref:Uncharacterized protein n=1 Tax=Mycena belliarum TaxID=1033014 RepID=A0AAD6XNN3_9AGAR|nr:hypothetical protein B0H15DRAFT_952513 [Mycena belliae]